MDVIGNTYIFYEDGSATLIADDGQTANLPAGSFSYCQTKLLSDGDVVAEIYEDGSRINIDDEVLLTLESEIQGVRFGEKYFIVQHLEDEEYVDSYIIFYEDGSATEYHDYDNDTHTYDVGYFTYGKTKITATEDIGRFVITDDGTVLNLENGTMILVLESAM